MVLAKEGQLSRACTTLLDKPPAAYSEAATKELRDRNLAARAEEAWPG